MTKKRAGGGVPTGPCTETAVLQPRAGAVGALHGVPREEVFGRWGSLKAFSLATLRAFLGDHRWGSSRAALRGYWGPAPAPCSLYTYPEYPKYGVDGTRRRRKRPLRLLDALSSIGGPSLHMIRTCCEACMDLPSLLRTISCLS
jgi:hypothetical protein